MAVALPPQHDVVDGVRAPRPGGLLVGAAAVPLGAAVLLAAGALPTGARAVLGLAVVVLGAAVLRTRGTASGARLGAGLPAGLGVVLVLGGAALTAAALAVGVAGTADEGGLAGWGAVLFWVLLAGTGLVLLGVPAGGRATMRTAEGTVGIALGLALAALTGPGASGLDGSTAAALLLMVALLGTAAAATARTAAGAPRIAALLAATVLAYLTGEATGLVRLASDGLLPGGGEPVGSTMQTVAQTAGLLLGAALLGLAFLRRDPLGGVLAAGLLLVAGDPDATVTVPAAVAAAGVVLAAVLVRSPSARDAFGRVLRHTGPERTGAGAGVGPVRSTAALAGALAVLAVQVVGLGENGWVGPAVAVLAVAGALAVAWARADSSGTVAAMAGLAAVHVAQPLTALAYALWTAELTAHPRWLVAVAVLQAAAAGAIVVRRRHPMVLALAAIVVADALAGAIFGLSVAEDAPPPLWFLVAVVGVPTVGLLAVGGATVFGPGRRLRALQGVALGLAYVAVLAGQSLGTVGQVLTDGPEGTLDGGRAVVAVLLALLLPLGLALVAASTARRPSVAGTAGVVLGTVAVAAYVGAVGVWTGSDGRSGGPIRVTDPLLGFDASGSGLAGTGAGWPVMLGVLGGALLAAAWWLESRRPAPAGAPVGG